MERRSFLKTVGGASGGLALGVEALLGADSSDTEVKRVAGLPYRVLGRTGQQLSVVGFPGLALIQYTQEEGTAGIRSALDHGLNYFDVAPAYGDGLCEARLGVGLQGVERSRYFLACKTKMRDKTDARRELEQSLKFLKTDHFDLYQLHHLRREEEVQQALGPDGAIETLLKAREEGKVKYLGFSAHTTKAAVALLKGFQFDTAMFPINFVELLRFGFGKDVLDLARQQGVAVLSIKAMSKGPWPKDMQRTRQWWYRSVEDKEETDLAIRFALSQANVTALIPPSYLDLLEKAIAAARNFRPITPPEVERLRTLAQSCQSLFQKDEAMAYWPRAPRGPLSPESPHEGCCGHWA